MTPLTEAKSFQSDKWSENKHELRGKIKPLSPRVNSLMYQLFYRIFTDSTLRRSNCLHKQSYDITLITSLCLSHFRPVLHRHQEKAEFSNKRYCKPSYLIAFDVTNAWINLTIQ